MMFLKLECKRTRAVRTVSSWETPETRTLRASHSFFIGELVESSASSNELSTTSSSTLNID